MSDARINTTGRTGYQIFVDGPAKQVTWATVANGDEWFANATEVYFDYLDFRVAVRKWEDRLCEELE